MTIKESLDYLWDGEWFDKIQKILTPNEVERLGCAIGTVCTALEKVIDLIEEP